jgi:hypothetical protein
MPANVAGAFTPKFSNAKRKLSARHHSAGLRREANSISARDASDLGASRRKN